MNDKRSLVSCKMLALVCLLLVTLVSLPFNTCFAKSLDWGAVEALGGLRESQSLSQGAQVAAEFARVLCSDMQPKNQAALKRVFSDAARARGDAGKGKVLDTAYMEWSRRGDDDGKRGSLALMCCILAAADSDPNSFMESISMDLAQAVKAGEPWVKKGNFGKLMAASAQPGRSSGGTQPKPRSGKSSGSVSGKYTEYGSTRPHTLYPYYDNRGEIFTPASPPRLVDIKVNDSSATIGQTEGGGISEVWKRKGAKNPVTLPFSRKLSLGGTVFRIYASESGAEHIVVSPSGDVVYLHHRDDKQHGIVFFDRGDTRRERNAQMARSSGTYPTPSFPMFAEVSKWCFAQPVKMVRLPPGGLPAPARNQLCTACMGTGICQACKGMGSWYSSYSGRHECGLCHFSGKCKFCNGTGRQ